MRSQLALDITLEISEMYISHFMIALLVSSLLGLPVTLLLVRKVVTDIILGRTLILRLRLGWLVVSFLLKYLDSDVILKKERQPGGTLPKVFG